LSIPLPARPTTLRLVAAASRICHLCDAPAISASYAEMIPQNLLLRAAQLHIDVETAVPRYWIESSAIFQ
jgi:hypothetical protein